MRSALIPESGLQALTPVVAEGKLSLGTWQQIFHLNCDVRPREPWLQSPRCAENA
jgi:thiamine phosphate synthase YjbQ (UPF0047 family)